MIMVSAFIFRPELAAADGNDLEILIKKDDKYLNIYKNIIEEELIQ